MIEVQDLKDQVIAIILGKGYQRRDQPFQLSSGGFSHDYVDCRKALGSGSDLRVAANAILAMFDSIGLTFELVGGLTMGADPISHAIAIERQLGWFSVRKQEKSHGTGNKIEGSQVTPNSAVLLVEDVVTSGASIIQAYGAVKQAQANVVAATSLLDRGSRAKAEFHRLDVPYYPLLTYQDLGIDPI